MLPTPRSPLPAPCSPLPALRIAVIGAGRLGGFHAQKLARMAGVELVGVVDPLAANRDRLAAELHTALVLLAPRCCWAASMRR